MPAYMIAEMDVTDAAAYEAYKKAAASLIERYGGRYMARGGRAAALEGAQPKRIVVVEFDSIEAAERWYRSGEYQQARKLRDGAADGRLFIVEAL
jgi:uncharacterized protein (DUF1330 family)